MSDWKRPQLDIGTPQAIYANQPREPAPDLLLDVGLISPSFSPASSSFGPSHMGSEDTFGLDRQHLSHKPSKPAVDDSLAPRTKIICTIGPASNSKGTLKELMLAGMNIVRMNFSHGDQAYHGETIARVRQVMQETRRICAILLDTKGPEIRTGVLQDGQEVELKEGQEFTLYTDETVVGDNTKVAVHYANLPTVLEVGKQVLIDDGLISLRVLDIQPTAVKCHVENGGMLGQRKGVNLPGVIIDLPAVTQKDVSDIKFAASQGLDFIAASFVRKAADVMKIREVLGEEGKDIKIISKIENQEGLDNFDDIVAVSDGIMVARGDLGVEIPTEQVAIAQKMMIRKCNAMGKFVITATQMLESMVNNPLPTRAEASDVANAVFDGTDCVMLSGETAKGKHPVTAVKVMASICRQAEFDTNYMQIFQNVRATNLNVSIPEAVASSAVKACFDLRAKLIIVLTDSGRTARLVAKYRPSCHILTVTASERVARQTLCSKGLFPLLVGSMMGTESLIERAVGAALNLGMITHGDVVIITAGAIEGRSGSTNMLKIHVVQF